MKVDQQKKTLQSKTGKGEKVKYKVSGDVFTFDLSGEKSSGHEAALEMFKTLNSNVQNNTKRRAEGICSFSSLKYLESV